MLKKIKLYVTFISLLSSLSYVTASEFNSQHTNTLDNKTPTINIINFNNYDDSHYDIFIKYNFTCLKESYKNSQSDIVDNETLLDTSFPIIFEPATTYHYYTDIYFNSSQSSLSLNNYEKIQMLKNFIAFYNLGSSKKIHLIHITSNTDSTGSFALNKKLSLQRAFSVKHFLLSQGLPEDKIMISAFTHKKTETNAHEQEKNRSVIIDFIFSE